jgi:putative phosphoesterase
MILGLISDTHGLLRPEAVAALQGCGQIIHAGDICSDATLPALAAIAPVTAVRGNNDYGAWAERLPASAMLEAGGVWIYVVHDIADLDLDPATTGMRVVVSGHSHQPVADWRDGVLFVNPGSAGPRRFRLPIMLAKLHIEGERLEVEFVDLASPPDS